jgi:transcriptional antiterminator RfaH
MQPPTNANASWYLVFSKAQQEGKAQANLERQGYRVFLPMIRQMRRRKGKRQQILEPMFPRYLFIHLDRINDNWGPIRSTFGVSGIVRFGLEPGKVPDEVIDNLIRRGNDEGIIDLDAPAFQPGDRVQILEGPMQGYAAIFHAKSSRDRVLLLLDLVGKQVRVQLGADSVGKLE